MNRLVKYALLSCIVAFFVTVDYYDTAGQQVGAISWSNEEILANIESVRRQSYFPVLAADPYGGIHLFWTQGDAIYYRYKDQFGWSVPIDIVWSDVNSITFPQAVVDQDGILHLVWFHFGEIQYKSVPSWNLSDVHQWDSAKTIFQSGGSSTPLRLVVDNQNRLHIVFADWRGIPDQTEPGNVYHMISSDNGKTWSTPIKVSSISNGQVATDPRIAVDQQGQVHIVWGLMDPNQEGLQLGVYYARFDPVVNQIVHQAEIASPLDSDKWFMAINVAVYGKEIHLVWVCGEQAQRCQTLSADGGDSWLPYQRVFTELIGLSGWDALVSDGAGSLFWITDLRLPQAMYYTFWNGKNWTDPPIIASTDSKMKLGENVMAVGFGNKIHVVAQLDNTITYMVGTTTAQHEEFQVRPQTNLTQPNILSEDTIETQTTIVRQPTINASQNINQLEPTFYSEGYVIIISSLSVVAFVSLILIIRNFKRR